MAIKRCSIKRTSGKQSGNNAVGEVSANKKATPANPPKGAEPVALNGFTQARNATKSRKPGIRPYVNDGARTAWAKEVCRVFGAFGVECPYTSAKQSGQGDGAQLRVMAENLATLKKDKGAGLFIAQVGGNKLFRVCVAGLDSDAGQGMLVKVFLGGGVDTNSGPAGIARAILYGLENRILRPTKSVNATFMVDGVETVVPSIASKLPNTQEVEANHPNRVKACPEARGPHILRATRIAAIWPIARRAGEAVEAEKKGTGQEVALLATGIADALEGGLDAKKVGATLRATFEKETVDAAFDAAQPLLKKRGLIA